MMNQRAGGLAPARKMKAVRNPKSEFQFLCADFLKRSDTAIARTLSTLIRIPTVNPYSGDPDPSGEEQGQAFIMREMRRLGGRVVVQAIPPDVYRRGGVLGPRQRDWTRRRNVIGRFRFGRGPNPLRIVLNGHMDTVGVSDFEGDPFAGRRQGDRIEGRGVSDCKGGLTAGLFVIQALQACGAPLNAEIVFESVVDEECNGSGAGTMTACLAGIAGDYAFLLDGMAGLIYTSCQGVATLELTVRGRAGHGSIGGSVSAVEKLLYLKRALDDLAADFVRRNTGCRINVGVLRAGLAPWTVPNHGWLTANINYNVADARRSRARKLGYNAGAIRDSLERNILKLCAADSWLRSHRPELCWIKDIPPGRLEDCDQPAACRRLLAAAGKGFSLAWNKAPVIGSLPAWSDYSHLVRLGRMPTVGMGSGEPGVSHTATEFNRVSNVRRTAASIALAILELAEQRGT